MRSGLAPRAVPVSRTPSEVFDDLVLDAVEELEEHWATELAAVEFAVEEVPPLDQAAPLDFDPEIVLDRGIPLGRLYRTGTAGIAQPIVVLYRRPIEARAVDRDDRADLVFMIVAELVAELLGKDVDEIDPH
jgi:zinicin-like metallopeptidase